MRALGRRPWLLLAALSTVAGTLEGADPRPSRIELRAVGIDLARLAPLLGIPVPATWIYVPNVALALGLDPDAVRGSFEAQRRVGIALGRVVAHELVHVLAPEREHAQAGVMRRTLGAFHLASGRAALEEGYSEALAKGARAWVASQERERP